MKKVILFIYLVIHTFLAVGQGCPGPAQRTALINLQRSNIIEGGRAGQLPLSDACGNLRYAQYVEVNLIPISYTPTATGNTENLSEFVETPSGAVWYIDWQGQARRLTLEPDRDWLKISNNGIPYAITDSIYTDNYAAVNMRVVWPKAQFLYGDSTSLDGGNAVGAGLRDVRLGFKRLLDSAAWSSIGQEGRTLTGRLGPQTNSFRIQKSGGVQPTSPTAPFRDIFAVQDDSLILMKDYPYTRVDTLTPINFLYTDEQGYLQSGLLSDLPLGGDVFGKQGLTKQNDTLFFGQHFQVFDSTYIPKNITDQRAMFSHYAPDPEIGWGAWLFNDWNSNYFTYQMMTAPDSVSLVNLMEGNNGVEGGTRFQMGTGIAQIIAKENGGEAMMQVNDGNVNLYAGKDTWFGAIKSGINIQPDSTVSVFAYGDISGNYNTFSVRPFRTATRRRAGYETNINAALGPLDFITKGYVDSLSGGGGSSYVFSGGLYKVGDNVKFGTTYDLCNEAVQLPAGVDSTQVVYIDNQNTDCPDKGVSAIVFNDPYGENTFSIITAPDSIKLLDWMNGGVTPTGDDTYNKFSIDNNDITFESVVDGYSNDSDFNEYGFFGNYNAPADNESNTVTFTASSGSMRASYNDFGVEWRQGYVNSGSSGVRLHSEKGVSNIAINFSELQLSDSTYYLYAQTSGGAIQNTSFFTPSGSTHSKKMAYTIDPAFTQDRDIIDRKYVAKPPYSTYNLSGSATGTVNLTSTETDNLIYNGAGTITSLTVNLPSSPANGQICQFAITSPVVSLTIGGGTINGNVPTSMVDIRAMEFKYYSTASAWVIIRAGY